MSYITKSAYCPTVPSTYPEHTSKQYISLRVVAWCCVLEPLTLGDGEWPQL